MIVKMKKVTLLCLADDRDRSLDALRDLGVLHLAPVKKPESVDLDKTRAELERTQSALNILNTYLKEKGDAVDTGSDSQFRGEQTGQKVVNSVHDLLRRKKEFMERLESLQSEKIAIEPFGDFDPQIIKQLSDKGITVKLYHATGKKPVVPPEGAEVFVIRHDSSGQYVALIAWRDFEFDGNEFSLPGRAFSAVVAELEAVRNDLRDIETDLIALSKTKGSVASLISTLTEKVQYLEAQEGMGKATKLAYLQGFCPVDLVDKLQSRASQQGWGLIIDDPAENDEVPTLIRNPLWVRPIEILFKFIKILPGYREVDVSAWFLPFFSLFFAMIVGDAGYGLIFLAITLLASRKFKKAPAGLFALMYIFSICTIIWGILSGTYFGLTEMRAPFSSVEIKWLRTPEHMMGLSVMIGAIHLSLAHIWNAIRLMNSFQALAQLGWAGVTWSIFFLTRLLLFNEPFPGWMVPVSIVAISAIVLFMTPWRKLKARMVDHFTLPLTFVFGFGDVMSYVRLFALGIASVEVARACNMMAGSVGFGGIVGSLASALILFTGHTINILLCCLSVIVHAVRLNTLEFSMHVGLEWAGIEYSPFSKTLKRRE